MVAGKPPVGHAFGADEFEFQDVQALGLLGGGQVHAVEAEPGEEGIHCGRSGGRGGRDRYIVVETDCLGRKGQIHCSRNGLPGEEGRRKGSSRIPVGVGNSCGLASVPPQLRFGIGTTCGRNRKE